MALLDLALTLSALDFSPLAGDEPAVDAPTPATEGDGPVGIWIGGGEPAPGLEISADGRVTGTDGCNRLMGE